MSIKSMVKYQLFLSVKENRVFVLAGLLLFCVLFSGYGQSHPVVREYQGEQLENIKMPVGGIGTGTISLRSDGALVDWELMNRPAKGFIAGGGDDELDPFPFFALFAQNSQVKVARALQGNPPQSAYEGDEGTLSPAHALPKFRNSRFSAGYPFGTVSLSDDSLPLSAEVTAWNPMIPGNADDSGRPVMVLEYRVTNHSTESMAVSVCGSIPNYVGIDGSQYNRTWKGAKQYKASGTRSNRFIQEDNFAAIEMNASGVYKYSPAKGSITLATDSTGDISYRTDWMRFVWGDSLVDFWDDFSDDGHLESRSGKNNKPMGSLSVSKTIEAGETALYRFYIGWNFPNRITWSPSRGSWSFYVDKKFHKRDVIGNWYSTLYADATSAVRDFISNVDSLRKTTELFVSALSQSDYPKEIVEAALFNSSTLRTQTVFRTPDGKMFGWEGIMDEIGSCIGSCTHVWNYEYATPFLYGELAKGMRDTEFNHATHADGGMSFRVGLPLDKKAKFYSGRASDGQMGTISRFYREWQLSGDDEFLKHSWSNVKNALSYAWKTSGWDSDGDGVMEGKQHNTMDIEYYGPNPEIEFWYLAALKAGAKMAEYLGDVEFQTKCDSFYNSGSAWVEENLFNGEYYEHLITPGKEDMRYQIGEGCMTDQLVGQLIASINGFGDLVQSDQIKSSFDSIWKYNHRDDLSANASFFRTYAMGDDAGLIVAAFPASRPQFPFPYFAEVWSGLEYSAAAGMLYYGMDETALQIVKDIRKRHDGRRRNPFNEPECGHHYARAMAAWALIPAWSGFEFSAVQKQMSFADREGRWFWSNGYSWGTATITKGGQALELNLIYGSLELEKISCGSLSLSDKIDMKAGDVRQFRLK